MAPVKIKRIVSATSEDPLHSAKNLLKQGYDRDKKWKCKSPGEKQAVVILELEEPIQIKTIDVGNEFSAFIEILVGNSSLDDSYKVLLVASSLMTLQEAKYGTNGNGVRFFKQESMSKSISQEKWDRVKVVCSQPYNKTIQYGLSFITIHPAAESSNETSPLGRFKLKDEKPDESLNVGSLFARRKETSQSELTGAAAIRAASLPERINHQEKKYNSNKEPAKPSFKPQALPTDGKTRTNVQKKVIKEDGARLKNGLNGVTKGNGMLSKRIGDSPIQDTPKKKIKVETPGSSKSRRVEKPFNKLLENVVFVISGFQNPLRGEIRSKALAMGAKYKADWDNTSSHLVCAFTNTPKFIQVQGHGKIVKKEWIEQCYSRRMRLPWRRYALDKKDLSEPVSEEEIFEETPKLIPSITDHRRKIDSDSEDTEDEIERVRLRQNEKKKLKHPPSPQPSTSSVNIYDMDTEIEDLDEEIMEPNLPTLSEIFEGLKFTLSDKLDNSERSKLKRYIVANKGVISEELNKSVDVLITEETDESSKTKEDHPLLSVVTPEWIWKSHDENSVLPVSLYEI